MDIKVITLGTGTPNACYFASGACVAVCVNEKSYLVDAGPGLVRQAAKAYHTLKIDALKVSKLTTAFITHLHSDHTTGLSDLILTPWVLERSEELKLYGPEGLKNMTDHLYKAYEADINMRLYGFEKANHIGYKTKVSEFNHEECSVVFKDEYVTVEAIKAEHGDLLCYSYKFYIDTPTGQKTVFISGDTKPTPLNIEKMKDTDLAIFETEYTAGLSSREEKWQIYHKNIHTTSKELAVLLNVAQPKLTATYHRIYHMDIDNNKTDVLKEVLRRDDLILKEIEEIYKGKVVNAKDLDVFTL